MAKLKVNVFLWKAKHQDIELAKKILDVIGAKAGVELETTYLDLAVSQAEENIKEPCISFGDMADRQYTCSGINWILPETSRLHPAPGNTETRQTAWKMFQLIANSLKAAASQIEEPIESHVEMADGITVGKIGTDIQISEQEAEYLRRLKELLGGSKMVIKKGDICIEVE